MVSRCDGRQLEASIDAIMRTKMSDAVSATIYDSESWAPKTVSDQN